MINVSVLFGLVLLLGQTTKGTPINSRIIGGSDVDIEDYPYQISLEHYGMHICGGSIISNIYIITAAHCTYRLRADELWIRAGTSILEQGGQIIGVKKIIQHPQYNNAITNYDIAILELEEKLRFDSRVQPIRIPPPQQTPPLVAGTKVTISGWGNTNVMDGRYSENLQAVELVLVENDVCQQNYQDKPITEYMICAGVLGGGKDACRGDSGGPLVVNNELFGIVSWGNGCGSAEYPGVYTNVLALRDFILYIALV